MNSSKTIKEYFIQGSYEELDELLHYVWDEEKLQQLLKKGTRIEVFLAGNDAIIDSCEAYAFFKAFTTVYFIKDLGHIL